MPTYSIKMRAAKSGRHVSGAERILPQEELPAAAAALCQRALEHGLGRADAINIKAEEIRSEELLHLDALPVSARPAKSVAETFAFMREALEELGLAAYADELIQLLRQTRPMRGAALYDIASRKRLEPDKERGIRATYMDADVPGGASSHKNHFREALVLATKVVHAPGMICELCISDDPEYVIGYIASKQHGYVRLSPMKKTGDSHGGRVWVFDSRLAEPEESINYLEKQKVLVHGLAPAPSERPAPQKILEEELEELRVKHLYRGTRVLESAQSKYVSLGGKKILLLSSNSYLDLANDARVKEAAAQAALAWGAGSGGSRLTTGTTLLHEELESALARFKHTEAALLFNTGYMANVGCLSALADSGSVIFSDAANHASIIDGARLSRARIVVYKHNDMHDLEKKILATPYAKGIIVSDSVFSMDGDIVDLPRLVALARAHGLLSVIDEAHATGVIGATGRGAVEHFGNVCTPDVIVGTLSKALGGEGGFVCASKIICQYLLNKARSFIFATSQAPAILGAALKALEILQEEPERVARLRRNVEYFCRCLEREGIEAHSSSAIVPIIVGEEDAALRSAQELLEQGLLVPAIRYPTVPKGSARLRVALMSSHSEEELARAARLIAGASRKYQD